MLKSNFDRIYDAWNSLIQSAERNDLENELKCLVRQCKNACDTFMSYVPNYEGLYNVERIISFEQFKKVYSFFNILKLENEYAYNRFTENHDIVNLKEDIEFKEEKIQEAISKLSELKDYASFLSHLILKVYDEKNEYKKRQMLRAMM